MKRPTEEEAQWLWVQCGVKPYRTYPTGTSYPDVDVHNLHIHAVPKTLEAYNIKSYCFKQASGLYYVEVSVWLKGSTKHGFEVLHDQHIARHFEQGTDLEETTALALFWAIHKAFEKELAS